MNIVGRIEVMASINGISVKSLKKFTGHEGEICYQGNIYLDSKNIGFWSQDDWGGPDRFNFESHDMKKQLNKRVIELNRDKAIYGTAYDGKPYTVDYDLDILMYNLVKLQHNEMEFKSSVKKGYAGLMIATDGCCEISWYLKEVHTKMSDEELLSFCSKMIESAKAKKSF